MTRRPYRSALYLKFIRSLPCCVCGTRRGVEAAHVGPHGMGQKADDTSVIPLCVRDHRLGPHSLHRLGRRRFEHLHGLDIAAIIQKIRDTPRMEMRNGYWVAAFGEEEYRLSKVDDGIDSALRKLARIRHERLTEKIKEAQYA